MSSMAGDFEMVLEKLRAGRLRVHVPQPLDLFRRKQGAIFHATPEFFLQTGGATDFSCPGETFRLKTHEVCVMSTGVPHVEIPIDLRTPYGIIVCMHARDGFFVQRAAASPKRVITSMATEHLASPRGREAFRYLDEISAVGTVPERHRPAFQRSLLEVFLITLLSELNRPSATGLSRTPLVAEAEKLGRALLADPELSVARLANSLGCSADYLSRRFHEERGTTLTRWIMQERVIMARDLLGDPQMNIAEIGWACGFNAPSYFIRVFREQTGMTPKAYRAAKT